MEVPFVIPEDLHIVHRTPAVPTILDVVSRTTGMGLAVVARVTDQRWVACGVQDRLGTGLSPGGEVDVEATLCRDVLRHGLPVIINDVDGDDGYRDSVMSRTHGWKSGIAVPIILPDGRFFGTLSALDFEPRLLDTPTIRVSFALFADLISLQLDAAFQLANSEAQLRWERQTADLREQFIAVLGHDLRNPLAAVAAGTRMLLRRPDDAQDIAQKIEQSVGRMSGLIDDVLDFARGRLGAGISMEMSDTRPLEPVLSHVVAELQSAWPDRAIESDIFIPFALRCDHTRIAQLLSNLLGNALTHGSPHFPVRVATAIDAGTLRISVTNGGDPIPPEASTRLFEPFVRAATSRSRGGLGLGLFIASEIARGHGGTLSVKSDETETSFAFTMPLPTKIAALA